VTSVMKFGGRSIIGSVKNRNHLGIEAAVGRNELQDFNHPRAPAHGSRYRQAAGPVTTNTRLIPPEMRAGLDVGSQCVLSGGKQHGVATLGNSTYSETTRNNAPSS